MFETIENGLNIKSIFVLHFDQKLFLVHIHVGDRTNSIK